MDTNFTITIGYDGLPTQEFASRLYKLYPGRKYFTQHTTAMHRKVWEFYNGKIPKKHAIHHINGNTWDNRIENLECLSNKEHKSKHKMSKEHLEKFWKAGVEAAKEWHSSEEGHKWHLENGYKAYTKIIPTIKKCQFCGKEYESKKPNRSKFCGLNCRQAELRRRWKSIGKPLRKKKCI